MKSGHWCRRFHVGLVLLYLLSSHLFAEDGGAITWIEGRVFELIGTDNRSVSYTNVLGDHVAEKCRDYLKAGSHDFRKKILVILNPEESAQFEESYRIQIDPRGQVILDLCWGESLSFETMCCALAESYLLQYARFNYGVGAEKSIRFWAASALIMQNYLSLRPAQKSNCIRIARQSEVPEIKALLSSYLTKEPGKKLNMDQGYWLLQILRDSGLVKAQMIELLDRAVAGENVEARIVEILSSMDKMPGIDLEDWWQIQMKSYLAQEHEFCDSLAMSRLWIQEMADFKVYYASHGKLENLMSLWTYRDDENVRSVLDARLEIISLRIGQSNPAYLNVALSLGALYETVLEAEHRHKFIGAVTDYLTNWEDAKRLHDRIDEVISTCDVTD